MSPGESLGKDLRAEEQLTGRSARRIRGAHALAPRCETEIDRRKIICMFYKAAGPGIRS